MCSSCVPATRFGSPIFITIAKDTQEQELSVPKMSIFLPLPSCCQKAFLPLKFFCRPCLLAVSFLLFHDHSIAFSFLVCQVSFKVCSFYLL